MAFFHTSKLPKRQLYGSRMTFGSKSNPMTLSSSCPPAPDYISMPNQFALSKRKKSLSLPTNLISDEEFVHNINQIIDRKNFRLIERSSEMQTEPDHVRIQIDCKGFLPQEIQVRAIDKNRLEVHGEHLEFLSQKLAIRKQMHRCYPLPDDSDIQQVHCVFAKSGVLRIKIPRHNEIATPEEAAEPVDNRHLHPFDAPLTNCGAQTAHLSMQTNLKVAK